MKTIALLLCLLAAVPAAAAGEAAYFLQRGQAALAAGDYEGALVALQTAQNYAPGDPAIEEALAAACNNYGLALAEREPDHALLLLQQAYALRPDNAQLVRNLAALYNRRGVTLAEAGQATDALAWFEKASQTDPGNSSARRNASAVLAQQGRAAFDERRFRDARELLARALTLDTGNVNALVTLGYIHYSEQDMTTALAHWRRALALQPALAQVRDLIAQAEREQQVEGALADLSSPHFEIRFAGEQRRYDAYDVLQALEEAYFVIGDELARYPDHRLAVLIYEAEDYRRLTGTPHWTGAVYDGKIRVPAENLFGDRERLKAILRHEFTHALVHDATGGTCPTWLNEGLAQWQEFRGAGFPAFRQLPAAVAENRLLTLAQLQGSFLAMDDATAVLAYEQSYAMVASIIRRNGFFSINRLLHKCREGVPAGELVSREFQLSEAKFTQVWLADYRTHLAR